MGREKTDNRLEVFEHFWHQSIPFESLLTIVEYIFSIPATSATIERVFASVNKLWREEKTRLQIKTLKSIVILKYNMDYTCTEFYKILKTTPELLQKVRSSEKFRSGNDGAGTSGNVHNYQAI